jgi:hypothetical protein
VEEETSKPKSKFNIKDKKFLGIIGVVIALLVLAAGAFFVFGNDPETEDPYDSMESTSLPELSPEDIGMVVTVRDDNRALMFELTKAEDIEYVEYIIEYVAETEEGTANQGIFGEMNIGKDGITETNFREFGTCSAGKCRYDNVISDVTINLKVRKTDGKEYKVTEIVELEEAS